MRGEGMRGEGKGGGEERGGEGIGREREREGEGGRGRERDRERERKRDLITYLKCSHHACVYTVTGGVFSRVYLIKGAHTVAIAIRLSLTERCNKV